jgi:hypothetical protein
MIWLLIIYLVSVYLTRWGMQRKFYSEPKIKADIGDLLIVFFPVVNTGFGIMFILTWLLEKLYTAKVFNLVEEFFKPREFGVVVWAQIALALFFIAIITMLIITTYNLINI